MIRAKNQPAIMDTSKWTLDTLQTIVDELAGGGFEALGQLVYWICKDGRVASCLASRGASVLQDASLLADGPEREAELLKSDFRTCVPPRVVNNLLTNLKLVGAAPVQVIYRDGAPILQPWSIQHFEQDQDTWQWYVWVRKKGMQRDRVRIHWGKENWLLLGTEIQDQPWFDPGIGWQVLGPLRIGGVSAYVWWLRAAQHGSISPVKVKTEGGEIKNKDEFFSRLDELGQILYIEMPYGTDLERLKSEPLDFQAASEAKREADKIVTEYLLGQSTTTRLEQGSYNAVEVLLDEVSTPLISLELTTLAYALNQQWVPLWKKWRGVSEDVQLRWKVQPFKEVQRFAEAMDRLASAVQKWPLLEGKAKDLLEI